MTFQRVLFEAWPGLLTMLGLLCLSAFFSASEAALFSLRAADRSLLAVGTRAQQQANRLLDDAERLLSAILFWNLVVNIGYFTLASSISLKLNELPSIGPVLFASFSGTSLFVIIFFSEMLPKSLAVLSRRELSAWVSLPLSVAIRAVDPIMPGLRLVNLLSRRLIWPSYTAETYLHVEDLERAIALSTKDANLIDREQRVLHNLVSLSDLRVDECMSPRSHLRRFHPPVDWKDVVDGFPDDGLVFITDPESDEIASLLDLNTIVDLPTEHLERYATDVAYVPWSAKAADVLQVMETKEIDTMAVVNEQGETIGVVRRKDLLDVVFTLRPSRSERLLNVQPVLTVSETEWQVTGMSNLRTLEDHFDLTLPESGSVTVGGVIQESMQRLPLAGDQCDWGPFHFEVIAADDEEPIVVRLRRRDPSEGGS